MTDNTQYFDLGYSVHTLPISVQEHKPMVYKDGECWRISHQVNDQLVDVSGVTPEAVIVAFDEMVQQLQVVYTTETNV